MKNTSDSIKKVMLMAIGIFSSFLSVQADDLQNSLNLDYFRTPEASAFKKYGEESVNEYTGTADISVPLYTVKCKDIEIPIVLRYDASGIKVEQDASWVGLGWNLMVGGCINYVCAGGHDMYDAPDVSNKVWSEYLSSEISLSTLPFGTNDRVIKSQTRYYKYHESDKYNWMGKFPLRPQDFILSYVDYFGGGSGMKDYIDWGWGERDFYSVNVMGKSFMFFVDPFTLNVYNIGKAGENFKVEREYQSEVESGISNQTDALCWKITDSNGYIYSFAEGDKFQWDPRTGKKYTSCWYLTKIKTPKGEEVEFKYVSHTKSGRTTRVESYSIPFAHYGGAGCCSNVSQKTHVDYLQTENSNMNVIVHYLKEIKTSNQIVTFDTSDSNECSGKKLNTIKVQTYDGTIIKTFQFSYSSFTPSNVGGNYAPNDTRGSAENRLKLDNVKEVTSSETLTTSFSYNSMQLPSKRSCAQDFWGYYNGQENKLSETTHTMLPTPNNFMSLSYNKKLNSYWTRGADRFSSNSCMQAAMLNRVDYPTGGYTTYDYEANTTSVEDFTLTEQYRKKQYDVSVQARFTVSSSPYGNEVDQSEQVVSFELSDEATCDLTVQCSGGSSIMEGQNMQLDIYGSGVGGYKSITLEFHSSTTPSHVESLTLPAGKYTFVVIPISNTGGYPFSIRYNFAGWYKETTSKSSYPMAVGGLRIKKISNYDGDNSLINYTTYDYSSGVLLNKIETIDYSNCYNMNPVGSLPGTHSVEVYTITPGHPRMPTFYVSCCPGIVGYSQVTKSKYNAKDNLEKRVVTTYRNNGPETMHFMDYYRSLDNGLIESQEIYDASNVIVEKTVNTYEHGIVDHYATNIVAKKKCLNNGPSVLAAGLTLQVYDFPSSIPSETLKTSMSEQDAVFDVWRYPYILSRAELTKTTTTEYTPNGGTIVKTKSYRYNKINHQVFQTDETTSLTNQIRRTEITYPVDRTDNISKAMSNAHRLNDVVEMKKILVENGQEKRISTQQTNYADFGVNGSACYLPCSFSTSIGNHPLETRSTYSYDAGNNVRSIIVDDMETVYIWSYKGQYPIAKIEGLTYAAVENAIGKTTIDQLLTKMEPSAAEINSLRDVITDAGGHITTYAYKPLFGITSQTLPNGNTLHYKYDGSGRLVEAKDVNDKTLQKYFYNYSRK